MINPTGQPIRNDAHGQGHYGAKRGQRRHRGTDYCCTPGQEIRAPISGTVVRHARPYSDGDYSGVLIQGRYVAVKLFYLLPSVNAGDVVQAGDVIGIAQDISTRYEREMTPHVHVEIESFDVDVFIGG